MYPRPPPVKLEGEITMAKKSNVTKHNLEIAEFLRTGGRKIPAGLAAKAKAETRSMLLRKWAAGAEMQIQGAKLYRELEDEAPIAVDDPTKRKTLDAILRLHRRVASKKLPIPKAAPARFPVSSIFSGTMFPPFAIDSVSHLDSANITKPKVQCSANENGQISASVVTSEKSGFNHGSALALVQFPLNSPGPGTLTISASPTYSFEWSANWLDRYYVLSRGEVALAIIGATPVDATVQEDYVTWHSNLLTPPPQFGFQFGVQQSLSVSLYASSSVFCNCYLAVSVEAAGIGWPGSLAVAMASATVPSISYEFVPELALPRL
jgi:hypothetical protein